MMKKPTKKQQFSRKSALTLAALGVVYGDIGTSPIYAFNEAVRAGGETQAEILGVLSLVFWTLTAVVSVKYLVFVLHADNRGEGGTLAMFSQLSSKIRDGRKGILGFTVFVFLMAAAMEFSDGILTPAISVISAVEGIKTVNPELEYLVVPITVVILAALFIFQFKGTHRLGKVFGPVMVVWFLTISVIGISQIAQNPASLVAINPMYAFNFVVDHGFQTLFVMAAVILAVTGAEALFADLGHFGRGPIRIGWFGLAGIALPLSYFGQGALILRDPSAIGNSFFGMVPTGVPALLLLLITTLATIIASQALISAVASLASQASQLGLLPRLRIRHTNQEERGQIFVPFVNTIVGIGSIALVIIFKSSTALAGAYSFAIAFTMLVSTIGLIILALSKWKKYRWVLLPIFVIFLVMDLALFSASATKLLSGAWLPLLAGFCVASMMWIWRKGRHELDKRLSETSMSWAQVTRMRKSGKVAMTDVVGIYPSAVMGIVPQSLEQQIRVLGSMPARVIVVNVDAVDEPFCHKPPVYEQVNEYCASVSVPTGFMQQRNVPRALRSHAVAEHFNERKAIYFVTNRSLIPADRTGLNKAEEVIFTTLHRNATTPAHYYHLPERRVITFDISIEV
jgi:KUP system potassium uptake protein